MGPWAFGVPLTLVSTLGLLLNGYVLLIVLGLSKQVNSNDHISITLVKNFPFPLYFFVSYIFCVLDVLFVNQDLIKCDVS